MLPRHILIAQFPTCVENYTVSVSTDWVGQVELWGLRTNPQACVSTGNLYVGSLIFDLYNANTGSCAMYNSAGIKMRSACSYLILLRYLEYKRLSMIQIIINVVRKKPSSFFQRSCELQNQLRWVVPVFVRVTHVAPIVSYL